jgi:anti-anti-sigma factor
MATIDPPDLLRLEHGVLVLSPQASLDSDEACRALLDAVRTELRDGGVSIVIDCRRVDRVDGRGLRAVLMAHHLAKRSGARLALCRVASKVRRVLALTQLDRMVPIADGQHEAVLFASTPGPTNKPESAVHPPARSDPSAAPAPIVRPERGRPDRLVGRMISHYRIDERLYDGSLGLVYRAEDTRSARAVALELVTLGFDHDIDIDHLRRQVSRVGALHHPSVGVVLDVEWDDGYVVVARELMSGGLLPTLLPGEGGPWSGERVRALAIQVAGALEAVHAHGFLHSEIRPTKIFITAEGDAKLLDVGLSWIRQTMVLTEEVVAFAAPEQVSGVGADARTDIYSLGIVLYALLTGSQPFAEPSDNVGRIMSKVLTRYLPPPGDVNLAVSAGFSAVVGMAVRKLPAERYQTAADLLADLRRVTI